MSFSRRLLSRVFIPNSPPFPSRPPTYTHVARLQLGNAYTPGIRALGRRALLEMSSEQLLDSLRLKVAGKPSVLDEPLTNDGTEEEETEKRGGGGQSKSNKTKEEEVEVVKNNNNNNNNIVIDEEEAQLLEKSSLFTFAQAFKVLRARDPALVRHLPVDVLTRIAYEAQATRSTQILDDLAADAVGTLISVPSVQAELIRVLLERHTLLAPGTAAFLLATLRTSGHLGIISPAVMTGMVRAALEQKGKDSESKREHLKSFAPYVLSLLEGTSLRTNRSASAIWRPPEPVIASLEFLRGLLTVQEEESALAVFQALVDVGFIPSAALEGTDESLEDFNLIIRIALVKACMHWNLAYEATGILRDIVSALGPPNTSSSSSPSRESGLQINENENPMAADDNGDWRRRIAMFVTETLFALLETPQPNATEQASMLIVMVSRALPSFRLPDMFLRRVFMVAMTANDGASAERLYRHLQLGGPGSEEDAGQPQQRHTYPPPPAATVRWLMEYLTRGSGNMHLARTLANQIVASLTVTTTTITSTHSSSSSDMSTDNITTTTNTTNHNTTTNTLVKKKKDKKTPSSQSSHPTEPTEPLPSPISPSSSPPSLPSRQADPIPLMDRARFVALVAENGFGTQARTLWMHYASEQGRNAIVGNSTLMLRMVSLFKNLVKMEERKTKVEEEKQQNQEDEEDEEGLSDKGDEDTPPLSSSSVDVGTITGASAPRSRPCSSPIPSLPRTATPAPLTLEDRRRRIADYHEFAIRIIALFREAKQPLSRATHLDLNALARAYFIRGDVAAGFNALRYLLRRQEIPDVVDLNIVLATLAEFDPHAAAGVIERMVERGLNPSAVTFGTVIHHALEKRDTRLANELVVKARQLGVMKFDSKTVSAMLLASVRTAADERTEEDGGETTSRFELRMNLSRAYAIVKSMTRADFVATPGTGQRCVAAALRAELPMLAFKFWMLLVRDKAEWADAEQVQERRALARAIFKHCRAGRLDVGSGTRMLAQLKAEGQREKANLVEMVKMKR
jgi:hypothetical protein